MTFVGVTALLYPSNEEIDEGEVDGVERVGESAKERDSLLPPA